MNKTSEKIDGRSKNGGYSTAGFAGAKKKPLSEKRVQISTLVAPDTLDKIKKIKSAMGFSIGVTIDTAIDMFFEEINNQNAQ